VERLARRLLGSPALARALVTTPSLLPAWLLATAAVLAAGIVVTWGTGTPWVALLAPALAGVGIAYAYGPGADPAFELSRSLPTSDRMVLLVRCLAVFGLNAGLGLVASLVAKPAADVAFAWLVPMTTLAALALAVSTVARSANLGVAAALSAWAFIVMVSATTTRSPATGALSAALLPWYLAATGVFTAAAVHASSGVRRDVLPWR
jgi:hypothetical protein